MTKTRRGFTLIELLVVIAIIGILAAMLFPVFARARESARKTQCLANVKNIAIAINMYLTDWDKFFPIGYESDKFAIQYFGDFGRNVRGRTFDDPCNHIRQANPYAREPVILDDYVKNRDVWRCPSAKVTRGPGIIVPAGRDGYWVNNFVDNGTAWYDDWMAPPCIVAYPTGWGGNITDSFVQGPCSELAATHGTAPTGAFVSGIGVNDNLHWVTPSSINDTARYITVGDNGTEPSPWSITSFAFPDVNACGLNATTTPCGTDPGCCGTADWANCSWSQTCGLTYDAKTQFVRDAQFRKSHTRHLGGCNLGFADGHAKWYMSDTILTQAPPFPDAVLEGVCSCWPGNGVE